MVNCRNGGVLGWKSTQCHGLYWGNIAGGAVAWTKPPKQLAGEMQ